MMTNAFPEEGFFEEDSSGIDFYVEDIDFKLKNQDKIESWIRRVVQDQQAVIKHISYVFCSDEYLHKINLEHLQHDTYTDIITFHYGDKQNLESDIFISIERVLENAKTHKESPDRELKRVIIHGILHLLGQKDKTLEQAKEMRQKEETALSLFDSAFS